MAIHFWNTKALAKKLAHNGVSERDTYFYYVATTVMWTALSYYAIAMGARIGWLFFYGILVVLVITVFGLAQCYQANGGDSGQHFVLRATCLSFPIALKINTVSVLLGWIQYFVFPYVIDGITFRDPGHVWDLFTFVWAPAFTALLFWRLWHHLSALQKQRAPNPPLNRTRQKRRAG